MTVSAPPEPHPELLCSLPLCTVFPCHYYDRLTIDCFVRVFFLTDADATCKFYFMTFFVKMKRQKMASRNKRSVFYYSNVIT
jgi:hypothetical protein